jgi:hypothetical protein
MPLLSDKRVIEMLREACEQLWIQNMQFRTLLKEAGVADWYRKLDTLEHSVAANAARAGFQKMYSQALAKSEEAALQEFLEKLPITSRIQ